CRLAHAVGFFAPTAKPVKQSHENGLAAPPSGRCDAKIWRYVEALEHPGEKAPKCKRYIRVLWKDDITSELLAQIVKQESAVYLFGPRVNFPVRQEIVRGRLLRAEIGGLAVESAKRYAEPFGRLLALSVIFKTGERREPRNLGVLVCRAVATVGLATNFFQNFSRIDIGHRIDSRSCRS